MLVWMNVALGYRPCDMMWDKKDHKDGSRDGMREVLRGIRLSGVRCIWVRWVFVLNILVQILDRNRLNHTGDVLEVTEVV